MKVTGCTLTRLLFRKRLTFNGNNSISGQMLIVLILLLSNTVLLELFYVQMCVWLYMFACKQSGHQNHRIKGERSKV